MIQRIAIVGGGPAGSTCAAALASGGVEVDLFEASHGVEKPCGGGVPGAALDEFPVLRDPTLARRVVREVHMHAPSGRVARIPLREGIHIFRRCELDSFLRARANEAGATIHEERVARVNRLGDDTWSLETDAGTRGPYGFLVGADGVRGIVRRSVAARTADEHLTLARYAYTPGVPREEMIIKFFAGSDGYLWVFPRTDHLSIGTCATKPNQSAARLEEDLRDFVRDHYPEAGTDDIEVKGYFIPADPAPPIPRAGDPWALIGDAGGFVDPITREGIAPAMRSAAVLADQLLARFAGRPVNGRPPLPATPALPHNLALAHRYREGFFGEAFLERMIWMASESRAVQTILADLYDGRQSYEGLKRRLLRSALPLGMEMGLGALLGRWFPPTRRPAA